MKVSAINASRVLFLLIQIVGFEQTEDLDNRYNTNLHLRQLREELGTTPDEEEVRTLLLHEFFPNNTIHSQSGLHSIKLDTLEKQCDSLARMIEICSETVVGFNSKLFYEEFFVRMVQGLTEYRSSVFYSPEDINYVLVFYGNFLSGDTSFLYSIKNELTRNLVYYLFGMSVRNNDRHKVSLYTTLFGEIIDFENKAITIVVDALKGKLIRSCNNPAINDNRYSLTNQEIINALNANNSLFLNEYFHLTKYGYTAAISTLKLSNEDIYNSVL